MKTESILRYGMFETSVIRSVSDNAYDCPVQGHFVHEAETVEVFGYCDGADDAEALFRLRFMPTRTGHWRYTLCVAGEAVDEGAFMCVASGLPGPLRQHERSPYHLQFDDGRPYFLLGNTAYNALVTYRRRPEALRCTLDTYGGLGFNWLRFALMQTTWPTLGEVLWPWGGTPERPDWGVANVDMYRDADRLIAELGERVIIASLILFMPADLTLQGAPPEALERHVRQCVGRYAARWNVVWNLANEGYRELVLDDAMLRRLGALIQSLDPYDHLTACHHSERFEFWDEDWTDMSSLQHRGLPGEVHRGILANRLFDKPVINEEYGYEGDNHSPPNAPEDVRRDHWAIALAGGYGVYGDKTGGPKVGAYFSGDPADAAAPQAPAQLSHLRAFFEGTGWVDLRPADALLSGCDPEATFCLAQPGQEYVVYSVYGQPFTLWLMHTRGVVRVRWYNPRSGGYATDSEQRLDLDALGRGGPGDNPWSAFARRMRVPFTPPTAGDDWVLHITRLGGGTAPVGKGSA